jgi:hypothetical protein
MIRLLIFFFLFLSPSFAAETPISELPLRSLYNTTDEALTSERILEIDPEEINPHRQRWILDRKVELRALNPIEKERKGEKEEKLYGLSAMDIDAVTSLYLRGPGPWFQLMEDFQCEPEHHPYFSTPEGSKYAADIAASLWEETLKSQKIKLALAMRQISSQYPNIALIMGKILFHEWLRDTESEWRTKMRRKIPVEEWRFYTKKSVQMGICHTGPTGLVPKKKKNLSKTWETLMESVTASEPKKTLLTRAPARRWNGLFSVRVSMRVRGTQLNGQFLIDSAAGMSMISSDWLKSQGIDPQWVTSRGSQPQRVTWAGGTSGLAVKAHVSDVEISGLKIPIQDFLMMNTDIFGPPENISRCCDGILGNDFLRRYVVELRPTSLAEVNIYDPNGFTLAKDVPWVEASLTPRGDLVSECVTAPAQKGKSLALTGLRWDTGNDSILDISEPWHRTLKSQGLVGSAQWKVRCGNVMIGDQFQVHLASGGVFSEKYVPATLGMGSLGRGDLVFDLPHGKIWFNESSLKKSVSRIDSGLKVQYVMKAGERGLNVKSISGPAKQLVKAGLKPGMFITYINSKPVEDLDLWEVEQHLSGFYGDTVSLEWKTVSGAIQVSALKLR